MDIEMGFDDGDPWDGDPTDPRGCIGDTEMFAYQDVGTRYEGGFTVPQTNDGIADDCFDDYEAGLIFIEHKN